jgi:hypothetical protein
VSQNTSTRCFQIIALSLVLAPSIVSAQSHMGSPEQQQACRIDVLRHCRNIHEDMAIADCLRANGPKLHLACRRVVQGGNR